MLYIYKFDAGGIFVILTTDGICFYLFYFKGFLLIKLNIIANLKVLRLFLKKKFCVKC